MLIVKREEFVRMPAGTIFAHWRPNCFMGIFEIKVDLELITGEEKKADV